MIETSELNILLRMIKEVLRTKKSSHSLEINTKNRNIFLSFNEEASLTFLLNNNVLDLTIIEHEIERKMVARNKESGEPERPDFATKRKITRKVLVSLEEITDIQWNTYELESE